MDTFNKGDTAYLEISKGVYAVVEIKDIDTKFGSIRYHVTPLQGEGVLIVTRLQPDPYKASIIK